MLTINNGDDVALIVAKKKNAKVCIKMCIYLKIEQKCDLFEFKNEDGQNWSKLIGASVNNIGRNVCGCWVLVQLSIKWF